MVTKRNMQIIPLLGLFTLSLLAGCEYDTPQQIYSEKTTAEPKVVTITPTSAVDGIMQIKITGDNFSPDATQDFVYFGTTEGQVINATANELTVIRPVDVGGSYMVKVVVQEAVSTTQYGPYTLEAGLAAMAELGKVNSIAVDSDENLYAETDEIIYKITPAGQMTEYGTIGFKSSAMRMGPDGYLYIQRYNLRDLFRIAPGGGAGERFVRVKKNCSFFDFDAEGYIYSGGAKYGLCVTAPDGASSVQLDYYKSDFAIKAIRVYDGYVYVAADTNASDETIKVSGIWRHELMGAGSVGAPELVFDWDEYDDDPENVILDLTFSENGDMYIGTNRMNPVLIRRADGTMQTLYAGLLTAPATQICWGSGNYLYINTLGTEDDNSSLKRVIMGMKGAPYYGRN